MINKKIQDQHFLENKLTIILLKYRIGSEQT